ncbi:1-aminocyclopropane-1-carboxylate deaminase/D-cysteine desulfhydrase [Emticicia agri]|nr:pyridoxal-phosphate dependent enzyme [Emticicia agri]
MLDFEKILNLPSPLEPLSDPMYVEKSLKVFVKRDDLIHPQISGNKWRKLKFNLIEAEKQGYHKLITFGGAHSNHLYAVAAIGRYFGFETTGIIRGDELNSYSSITLQYAHECGMQLQFVSRQAYKDKNQLLGIYRKDDQYVLPEGGTNTLSLAGVGEMVQEIRQQLGYDPDYIICPVGTGGTIAGILSAVSAKTTVVGVCVLKNANYLENEITTLLQSGADNYSENYRIFWEFHHRGYAKKTPQLMSFIEAFNEKNGFSVEPVYSGKMFYAFDELVKNEIRDNSTIVLIHTGGLR